MIRLVSNSALSGQLLQAVLAGAVSANQPEATVSYIDMPPQSTAQTQGQRGTTYQVALNSSTDVTIASPPGAAMTGTTGQAGYVRMIDYIGIYNKDTASITLTVKIDDAGTEKILWKGTLLTLESLYYEHGAGWYATDANGNTKESLAAASNWAVSGNLTVAGNTTLGDAAADSLTINAGIYSAPNIPCFLAYNSSNDTNVTGAGTTATVDFDTEVFDQGSNFAADTFTAPTTGRYHLETGVTVTDLTTAMTGQILSIVTSNRTYQLINNITPIAGGSMAWCISCIADMDAGDTATVTLRIANGAGDTADIVGGATLNTYFSGKIAA